MNKFIAIIFVVAGVVYSEFESSDIIFGYILPSILVLSLLYLFGLKGFLIITAACTAYYYMDLGSSSVFKAALLPIFFGVCIIYFIWWLSLTGWHAGWYNDFGDDGDGGGDGGD